MATTRIPSVEGGIQPTLLTTKGDLISATAASTVARLPVGSDAQILVADSTASTGLAYKGVGVANGLTTTGDTIYSSSGTTQSRLGIGSTGQVLTVASGIPSWATPAGGGGMDLLSTIDPSGATGVSFTSIDQTYDHLLLIWQDVFQSSNSTFYTTRFNSASTGYSYMGTFYELGVNTIRYSGASNQIGATDSDAPIPLCPTTTTAADNCRGQMWIYNYSSTTVKKRWQLSSIATTSNSAATTNGPILFNGFFNNTAAITQIDFNRNSTQTITGKFQLWGVK